MSALRVHHSSAADRDVGNIVLTISRDNPAAALRVADAIDATVRLIAKSPALGEAYPHPRHAGLRRFLVNQFPNYAVYYQADPNELFVVRVLHAARDVASALSG
ncbi:Plasmid stabilization system protein [Pirellulimonas nuda]|uniref:Plasmid stabilization system protein n=1 Tax=Pirellulimonas nuda TaxID=2528009 RepID=A0A518DJA2_9BACT|nr:type II toxin-antitoxin system RelE/ParE family toxin [Pirellulimonas nuda]QDU91526.1 Plasmid stabilization system protein [Pirellulimonas nuda]